MPKFPTWPLLALGVGLAPAAIADEPVTVGKSVSIHSKTLNEDRTLLIQTPPACEGASARCPVLYLTDAETQFVHTVATAGFLARNNLMPPVVVVGITNVDRVRDLTPTHSSPDVSGRRNPLPTSGGADNFLRFMEADLFPYIEKAQGARPYRIFCGHSLGGLFGLHALFSRPELFNAIVAVSPTLVWDDDLPLRRAREFFAARPSLDRTLFVAAGSEGPEMEQAFDELQKVLARAKIAGFASATLLLQDEDHGSVVLRSHYAALRKIFESWRPPVDPLTGALEGGLETVIRHYAGLTERFGYPVQPPEGLVNAIGYAQMSQGRLDLALEAFRLNVANYPESANVHDSLGDGLDASGRLREARDSYARAVALAEKAKDRSLNLFRQHLENAEKKLKAPSS